MIEVVPAKECHIQHIALNMRLQDRLEIRHFNKLSPIRALKRSCESSILCWSVLEDDIPIAMFGVGEEGMQCLSDDGIIWFLGTDRVAFHPIPFLRHSGHYIEQMLLVFKSLTNLIHRDNMLAVKFAKKLARIIPNCSVIDEAEGVRILINRG